MKGIVKKVSDFTNNIEWLFIISDEKENEYLIMNDSFYKKNNLKSPITKRELDSLDEDMIITFEFIKLNDIRLVTELFW